MWQKKTKEISVFTQSCTGCDVRAELVESIAIVYGVATIDGLILTKTDGSAKGGVCFLALHRNSIFPSGMSEQEKIWMTWNRLMLTNISKRFYKQIKKRPYGRFLVSNYNFDTTPKKNIFMIGFEE